MQEFLLYLAKTTKNAFAISIQRSTIFLLTGHESATFRKCPDADFAGTFPPEMVEDVQWFTALVRGLSRMRAT